MDNQEKIDQLLQKLELLIAQQEKFASEVQFLKTELNTLKSPVKKQASEEIAVPEKTVPQKLTVAPVVEKQEKSPEIPIKETEVKPITIASKPKKKPKSKSDIEKFIGENLINKIGIAITVIGVAIGAKYSIENDLISPLTRIILGYLMGVGLLGFGMKLKKKYENYSAVLVSGAIAIMYVITFLAYSFYDLFPQGFAFGLMLILTVFTVFTALQYNKQVIAHIGLVGAYAVPFLLSSGSGRFDILFGYMVCVNTGILVIAFKRYWKALYYVAFLFTYMIYSVWFITDRETADFGLAFAFLAVFFLMFYLIFIAYKVMKKEKFNTGDVVLLLLNSFLFYGLGFCLLEEHEIGQQLLGVFTLGNAIVHFVVSVVFYRQKLADRNLFYLAIGMVLTFITITIPVQLDGHWVSLLWTVEAALLFWIGRVKNVVIYEKISYVLMVLALISLSHDWSSGGYYYTKEDVIGAATPFLNVYFLTTLLCAALFGYITKLNAQTQDIAAIKKGFFTFFEHLIPWMFIGVLYFSFRFEIEEYWSQHYAQSYIATHLDGETYETIFHNEGLRGMKSVWILNYSMLFVAVLSLINTKKIKHRILGFITVGITFITAVVFMTQGLYELSELRDLYLRQEGAEYYNIGSFNLIIRYISIGCFAVLLWSAYQFTKQQFVGNIGRKVFGIIVQIILVWLASSELIHWMDIFEFSESYKLGLSILWGVYSLGLIVLGISKDKKYLRVLAIVLFGITLVKLFLYDISELSTIAKTIVFVSLGILLLIISFLYTKYKHLISNDNEN